MKKIRIIHEYYTSTEDFVTLPEGKTIQDIAIMYVKWGTAFISFNDGTYHEEVLTADILERVDYKHPFAMKVHPVGADDVPDESQNWADKFVPL